MWILSPFLPLLLTLFLLISVVAADPVEVHARREVLRRQQLDNSTHITASSIVTPTTSLSPTTSPSESPTTQASSTLPPKTESSSTSSSTSYSTSFFASVSTITTDYVTTIDGVQTTVPTTYMSTTLIPTLVPSLQNNVSGSGLSNNSKKIVIGVVVGVGGTAFLALIAVIIWRQTKRESEQKENTANLTYFSDDPAVGYGRAPTENVLVREGEFRPPAVNAAANF
jgi:Mid2 like cell wall stress sensor